MSGSVSSSRIQFSLSKRAQADLLRFLVVRKHINLKELALVLHQEPAVLQSVIERRSYLDDAAASDLVQICLFPMIRNNA
nr:hypothetical protein 6 [Coxiellaceae bacterium]